MEDFFNGVTKIMEEVNLMKQSYSNDIEDVLKKLNTIVSKAKEKQNDKTPKPERKKLKRANAPFEKLEDGNTSTIQNVSNQSYRLTRAGRKISQAKQASTSLRQKGLKIEMEVLSDNELHDPKKSINTKIKKDKINKSPQTRRVTRASSRNQNLSINLSNENTGIISVNESVEVIPEEASIIILSEQDENTKEKRSEQELIISEQSEKRITRSLKKSSSLDKNNTSANTSAENVSLMFSNNNDDENNKNRENVDHFPKFYSDLLKLTLFLGSVEKYGQFERLRLKCWKMVNSNIIPEPTGESTFVVNRQLPDENENRENKLVEIEKTFILPQSELQNVHILNPNIPVVSKGEKPVPESRAAVASSNDLKKINTAVLKPKNTGALPKQPSKDIKGAGVNKKIAACSVLLKKPSSSSIPYKSPLTRGKPISAKAASREYNNNLQQERKKAVSQSKYQSPNLMQIQQEKEFLRRLEKKRLEIKEKDKQKLAKQIAMEQQIKKSIRAIEEKKLQIAQNKQKGDLQKKAYNFNTLNSEDSTDDENSKSSKKCEPPLWSKRLVRKERIECQNFMSAKIIDSFFSVAPLNPDLREIFPEINPAELKRNSSIFWRTPPRYSQLPKY